LGPSGCGLDGPVGAPMPPVPAWYPPRFAGPRTVGDTFTDRPLGFGAVRKVCTEGFHSNEQDETVEGRGTSRPRTRTRSMTSDQRSTGEPGGAAVEDSGRHEDVREIDVEKMEEDLAALD